MLAVLVGLAVLIGVLLPARADACPSGASCLTISEAHTREEIAAAKAPRPISLQLRRDPGPSVLERELLTFEPPEKPEVEMPWFWRVLRDGVYDQMPTYEDSDQRSVGLAPVVVVSGAFDTAPGLGLAGEF